MASEKNLNQKKEEVTKLANKMKEAKLVLLTDYRGINVEDVTELRAELRKTNAEYTVIKNNITKRALAEAGIEGLEDKLVGGCYVSNSRNSLYIEELFVRNATVMNLGIIGIRNNKYACSYGVIKYFVEKLDLREKKYTMYGDEKIEEIMSTRKKIGATGVLGKVFDKIFD